MALRKPLREAPRLLRDQPIPCVSIQIVAVLRSPQLFFAALNPVLSLVKADEERSQSDATAADCCSDAFDDPQFSH